MSNSVILALGILVAGSLAGIILPEKGVKTFNNLDGYAAKYLDKKQVLKINEELIAFYDLSFFMNARNSLILTKDRIIHHYNKKFHALNLYDIEEVYFLPKKKHEHNTLIIKDKKGSFMSLALYSKHQLFYKFLEDAIQKAKIGDEQIVS
jgi:hypothetical protein